MTDAKKTPPQTGGAEIRPLRPAGHSPSQRMLVVYYSLTGSTRKAATSLAERLGATLAEIRCERYAPGIFGRLRATWDSVRGKLPPIFIPVEAHERYDLVVVAAPIWAGHPATPIRTLLAGQLKLPANVAVLLTHIGSPPEPVFAEMETLMKRAPVAKRAVKGREIKADGGIGAMSAFAAELWEGLSA